MSRGDLHSVFCASKGVLIATLTGVELIYSSPYDFKREVVGFVVK
jgi:hypothetical protein